MRKRSYLIRSLLYVRPAWAQSIYWNAVTLNKAIVFNRRHLSIGTVGWKVGYSNNG